MSVYRPANGEPPQVEPGDLTPADKRRLRGARGTGRGRVPECCVDAGGTCPQHAQMGRRSTGYRTPIRQRKAPK